MHDCIVMHITIDDAVCCYFIASLRPELKDLVEHVTPQYAIHWKEIGILIGVPVGEIQAIELGHPTMPKVCCNEMFTKWLECDVHANWDKVFAAIDSPAVPKPIICKMPGSGKYRYVCISHWLARA